MILHPTENAKARKAFAKAKLSVSSISSGHVIISRHQKLLPKKRTAIPNTHSRKHQSDRPPQPPMEDVMMLMTTKNNNKNNNNSSMINIPITTPACPTWKLYENPFYTTPHHNHNHHPQQQQKLQHYHYQDNHRIQKQIHRLHLPVPTKKLAASFWDLTFITNDDKPSSTESELEITHARIEKLKAELEHERKARKRMESLNKRLARQLSEERRSREALVRVCQELAKDMSFDRAQISRMKKEIEDERRMLRTAEVIREERVQMKLTEAKMLLEEKIGELDQMAKKMENDQSSISSTSLLSLTSTAKKEEKIDIQEESVNKKMSCDHQSLAVIQRRASAEAENPHVKRGIKGFVEFPRVVRAIGCRSGKRLGSKLECKNAQLKILLKQKGPVSNHIGLIAS